jgi:uncharacterized protein YdiU (UPF0061 family)
MIWHACKREYTAEAYDPYVETNNLEQAATKLLDSAAVRIADMVNGWVRVGFAQGNFNGDNCLVGGRTMDYGTYATRQKCFSALRSILAKEMYYVHHIEPK